MYADDVILISESEVGLHNCLKKLDRYCELCCLEIDIDKTKTIIFNKYFNSKLIKNVKTYEY